jgi:hypothetical protein
LKGGEMQSSLAILAAAVGIRQFRQQQLAALVLALGSSTVQGNCTSTIGDVHICPCIQQHLKPQEMSLLSCFLALARKN